MRKLEKDPAIESASVTVEHDDALRQRLRDDSQRWRALVLLTVWSHETPASVMVRESLALTFGGDRIPNPNSASAWSEPDPRAGAPLRGLELGRSPNWGPCGAGWACEVASHVGERSCLVSGLGC